MYLFYEQCVEYVLYQMSRQQAEKLIKRHLPWFRTAKSKFFVCQHCECRRKDVELVNKSPLPIHLVLNKLADRHANENSHSKSRKDAHKAATLHPNQWLPTASDLDLMIKYYLEQKTAGFGEKEASDIRAAIERLKHTQLHYNETLWKH